MDSSGAQGEPVVEEEEIVEAPSLPPATDGERDAVGLFAYSALAAMTRLAKDGDQAPDTQAHVDMATMSDRGFRRYQDLDEWARRRGFSLVDAAAQYSGLFDELDARTRPSSWWERSIKSYVVLGMFADVLRELSERHQILEGSPENWDLGHGAWVRDTLAPLTETDSQLAARLSLWARRVAGEAFGLLRATLFTYPGLAMDPDTVDAVVAYATERHKERLEAVNLTA